MSRRFGRNQRRRAREAIAELRALVDWQHGTILMDRELTAHISAKLRDAEEQLNRVRNALGDFNALLEPVELSIDVPSEMSEEIRVDVPVLRVVSHGVEVDRLRQRVHCFVRFKDKAVRYAVSDTALYSLDRERFADYVLEALAQPLAKGLAREVFR